MAPHSSTLAWKIPWTEEPLGLQSVGSQRVGHNWSNLAAAAAACLVIIAFASPNGTVKREHIIHTTHVYFHTEETEFILHQGEDYDSLDWSIWGKKIKIKYALLIFPLGARYLIKLHICARSVMSDSSWSFGLQPTRVLCPWDFSGKNIWMSYHFFLQGLFPSQGLNPHLLPSLHYRQFTAEPLRKPSWQPTLVLLPGKSHGWRSVVGYSPWGRKELDMTEWLHFHFHAPD